MLELGVVLRTDARTLDINSNDVYRLEQTLPLQEGYLVAHARKARHVPPWFKHWR